MIKQRDIYGLLAEFDGPESLMTAAEKTCAAGYHSHRRVHALPRSRLGRGAGPSADSRAAIWC